MPKVSKKSEYTKKYTKDAIDKAIEAVKNGMGQRKAAATYGVPRATIQFRLSDRFKKTSHGPMPVLTNEEKNLLENWINVSVSKGFPRRKEDIQESVKEFLEAVPRKNPFMDNYPGDGWYNAFLQRHPNISLCTPEGVTAASSTISENNIKKCFKNIENYLDQKEYKDILDDPSRIFNGDETCFMLCPKNKRVLAPRGVKNVYEIEHNPKANLTVMFTFSASGHITPPMIIYPYKRLPQEIAKSVPDTWGIGYSDNGWMKASVFYDYIKNVLHPHFVSLNIIFPVILFVDGHATHLTVNVSELCTSLGIIMIALYPNSTRVLQPADVSAFRPLKSAWKSAVSSFKRNHPDQVLTKEKFAHVLNIAVDTLKSDTIINGFKARGLYPWNSNAIDYAKCLGKKSNNERVTTSPTSTDNAFSNHKSSFDLEQFKMIVGEDNIRKFDEYQFHGHNDSNEYFVMLYQIYNQIKINNHCVQSSDGPDINLSKMDNELLLQNIDIENTPILFVEEPYEHTSFTVRDEEYLEKNSSGENDYIPDTLNDSVTDNKIRVDPCDENQCLNAFITFPKTPERKGKKKITEKVSFVITSTDWKKANIEKEKAKKEAEVQKEKRKIARVEKKKQKEMEKEKKLKERGRPTKDKGKSKIKIIEKDLETDVKNNNNSDVNNSATMENEDDEDNQYLSYFTKRLNAVDIAKKL